MPHLSAEKSYGTREDISEEELYRFTRYRWIYNESTQVSKRYLKFDLQQLLKVAVGAVSSRGAKFCTKVVKCCEGLNNKAYLLQMDNGLEVFAKLPNPIAGPAYYTTASEVATRAFLRNVLNIRTPLIVAWCADRNNPVGAEYILEEKVPGVPLGSLWYQWALEFKVGMVSQIVEIERRLASIKFMESGCIYFKGADDPAISLMSSPSIQSSVLEQFTLGPLVSRRPWRDERISMDMNRGPYNTPLGFIEAIAKNEIQFIKAHARSRINYHRSSTELESPEEAIDLLDRYLQLAKSMVPPLGTEDTHSATLWHPDLHLDNVFVDPESKQITCIIDWQSAAVMPLYYECRVPKLFDYPAAFTNGSDIPELPDGYETLTQSAKAKINSDREREICCKYYLAETMEKNPRHWAALQLRYTDIRTGPSRLATNMWEDDNVFFFRRALLEIVRQWQNLCPESGSCPVVFTEQELASHAAEEESRSTISEILRMFRDRLGLPPDGMVDLAEFDQVESDVAELKETFIEGADNEEERELFARLWPYQDVDN